MQLIISFPFSSNKFALLLKSVYFVWATPQMIQSLRPPSQTVQMVRWALQKQACRSWYRPPDFGSLVHPISTRGGRLCSSNYNRHPRIISPAYGSENSRPRRPLTPSETCQQLPSRRWSVPRPWQSSTVGMVRN